MSYFFDNLDDYELTHKLHKIALLFFLKNKQTLDALKRILERDFRTLFPQILLKCSLFFPLDFNFFSLSFLKFHSFWTQNEALWSLSEGVGVYYFQRVPFISFKHFFFMSGTIETFNSNDTLTENL